MEDRIDDLEKGNNNIQDNESIQELTSIICGGEKDLAKSVIWTNGAWSFTNGFGPESSFLQDNYRFSKR